MTTRRRPTRSARPRHGCSGAQRWRISPEAEARAGAIVGNAPYAERRLRHPRRRLFLRAGERSALADGLPLVRVKDCVLGADPPAIEIENNVQAPLDWTERGLRITNVRDVHATQSGEMLNSPKLGGEVRHSNDSRSRPKSGRSKHGAIPAMLYPGNARILPRAAPVNDAACRQGRAG
jgi:hypothetical protein